MTPPIPGPETGLNAAVAEVLRAERGAKQLTFDQLADAAGIPTVSVRRYLKAERHIDVAVLDALARALGTNSAAIVGTAAERMARAADNVVRPTFGPGARRDEMQIVDDEAAWDESDQ